MDGCKLQYISVPRPINCHQLPTHYSCMVFDYCQMNVFFHMRSHYRKLRNVQSAVDCSAPKALKRSSHSDTSFQYGAMAHLPHHSHGLKKHNCMFPHEGRQIEKGMLRSSIKTSIDRPETRRHPEDTPSTPNSSTLTVSSDKSPQLPIDRTVKICGQRQKQVCCFSSKTVDSRRQTRVIQKSDPVRVDICENFKIPAETPRSKSCHGAGKGTNVHVKRSNLPSCQQPVTPPKPKELSAVTDCGCICRDTGESPPDHEYLQFLLRITEDIIKNDLYANKEMKKVFMSHINANKDRLSLNRMLLQVHELMKELSMPFCDGMEEASSPSWTEIETAMKGLLSLEKIKPKETLQKSVDSKSRSATDDKCMCSGSKPKTRNTRDKSKSSEGQSEKFCCDNYSSGNKFGISLDRLTECTEPLSSQATCHNSTVTSCSTFGNVDVLPGFESLETPRISKSTVCRARSKPKPTVIFRRVVCDRCCMKRKPKRPRRRRKCNCRKFKKRKTCSTSRKRPKWIETCTQVETEAQSHGTDPHTELHMGDLLLPRHNGKPILISFQERKKSDTECSDICVRNSRNDYVLVKGPIYLLKAFMDENPSVVMRIDIPPIGREAFNSPCISTVQKEEEQRTLESQLFEASGSSFINSDAAKEVRKNGSVGELLAIETNEEIKNIVLEEDAPSTMKPPPELESTPLHDSPSIPSTCEQDNIQETPSQPESPYEESNISLCEIPCPHFSICNKFNPALVEVNCSNSNENKLMTNDYDLTPQKEYNSKEMNELMSDDYATNVAVEFLQDFLTSREIQTEHFHQDPTIVATAVIRQNGSFDNSMTESEETNHYYQVDKEPSNDEDEVSSHSNEMEKTFQPARTSSSIESNNLKFKEGEHSNHRNSSVNSDIVIQAVKIQLGGTKHTVPPVDSTITTETVTSTATVVKTNRLLDHSNRDIETEPIRVVGKYKSRNGDSNLADDNNEIKETSHHRRVSILKNPVQIPIERVFTDHEDLRRKSGSIIKTVEVIKERQANKDHFLNRVLQDIESSREMRSDRVNVVDFSERPLPEPSPPAIKSSRRPAYVELEESTNAQDDESLSQEYDDMNRDSSYDELPIKIASLKGKDFAINSADNSSSVTLASSGSMSQRIFLPEQDEQPEPKISSHQMNQINVITAKLDQFRHANDRDETEISTTLDKLVSTLKEQQEHEDETTIVDEIVTEEQSKSSTHDRFLRCCGLCKKKKTVQVVPVDFVSPPQSSFTEEEYRSKSAAFETALLNLGQKSRTNIQHPAMREVKIEKRERDDFSPIFRADQRLSFAATSSDRDRSLNLDFDQISIMSLALSDADFKRN